MDKIIDCRNITKAFGKSEESRNVLDAVSLEMRRGEFIAVMGPSGSGKSTLMFALSGMDKIDEGYVSFNGKILSDLKEKELARIHRTEMGFVFQQPTLLRNLNILDNIVLPSLGGNKKNRDRIIEKAKTLMENVGILGLEKRNISEVSGGQLQRAGICRALMNNPDILFGDEPTGALNSKSAHEIMQIFSKINIAGTAVLLVTHDAKVAAFSERILFMNDGKIVSELCFSKSGTTTIDMDERIKELTAKIQQLGI